LFYRRLEQNKKEKTTWFLVKSLKHQF